MWRRFGLVLGEPGLRRLLFTAVLARMPLGMWSLAIVLFVRERTHSFAAAGLSVGVYAAATAVASPMLGISVDRLGRRPVLLACAVVQPVALLAFVLATGGGGRRALGLGLVAVAGASVPPVSACLRSLWLELVPPASRDTVYALDAVAQEVIWTLGPLLVGAAAAIGGTGLAVVLCGATTLAGTTSFASNAAVGRGAGVAGARTGGPAGALGSAGLRAVLITMLLVCMTTGALQVGIPALAKELDAAWASAPLLAAWSIGSMAGGIVYGVREWESSLTRRYGQLIVGLSLLMLPLAAAGSVGAAFAAALLAGTMTAPVLATEFRMIGALAPPGRATESFTWNTSAITAGLASGAALAGALSDAVAPGAVFVMACGVGLSAAFFLLVARHAVALPSAAGRELDHGVSLD